eukprot:1194569-Prorocentrum_minimum.AAC.6
MLSHLVDVIAAKEARASFRLPTWRPTHSDRSDAMEPRMRACATSVKENMSSEDGAQVAALALELYATESLRRTSSKGGSDA